MYFDMSIFIFKEFTRVQKSLFQWILNSTISRWWKLLALYIIFYSSNIILYYKRLFGCRKWIHGCTMWHVYHVPLSKVGNGPLPNVVRMFKYRLTKRGAGVALLVDIYQQTVTFDAYGLWQSRLQQVRDPIKNFSPPPPNKGGTATGKVRKESRHYRTQDGRLPKVTRQITA
jgi:hypothetical protein